MLEKAEALAPGRTHILSTTPLISSIGTVMTTAEGTYVKTGEASSSYFLLLRHPPNCCLNLIF